MKNKILLILFLSIIIIGTTLNSCKEKFKYKNSPNAVTTLAASDVLQVSANVSGVINTDNDSYITVRGVCYSVNNNPTTSDSKTLDTNPGLGNFTCNIKDLLPSTLYYAKAFATNSYGTAYGKTISFKTQDATIPIISSTTTASLVTQVSARSGGVITNSGASNVTSRGVCWSNTNATPTISDSKTTDGAGIGTFTSSLTSLSPNTTYNIRAYATNSVGTAYGDVKTFRTSAATIPIGLGTTSISSITQTTAVSGGIIKTDGGAPVAARGVCWSSTTSSPTIANSTTNNGSGIGSYTSSLTGLLVNTTYYVRAYATNSAGTAYGNVITFRTSAVTIPIGLSTTNISSTTQTTAVSGGNINADGGAPVTARGVCWSSNTTSPTISNSTTNNGNGIGSFSSSLTDLLANTTYYVRAYATNNSGTAYGNVISFRTIAASTPTGLSTASISSVTQTTAVSGGNINADGGAPVTAKGVCWSNSTTSPTISNSRTNNGNGIGSFTSSLTGLLANTTYYVRAYATNSAGTAYGNMQTFSTSPNLSVGQQYQGGVIAYVFVTGDNGYVAGETHGLIVSSSNQSSGALWGCSGTSISGAANTAIGTGLFNTSAIVSGCSSSNTAASLCFNLSSGGFSDWYLPSRDELNKLYLNKSVIGGFASYYYWSSSQISSLFSLCLDFSSGASATASKNNSFYVRAVRKF
jgi:hypothetical protein